jgi:hypothetical protein
MLDAAPLSPPANAVRSPAANPRIFSALRPCRNPVSLDLELALERGDLGLRALAHRGVHLARGALDLVQAADGLGRVERVERLAEVFGLGAEELHGGLGLLDRVLDRAEPIEHLVEALRGGRAALADLLAHLLGVQAERFEPVAVVLSRRRRGSRTP